jgi:hypothetical protein
MNMIRKQTSTLNTSNFANFGEPKVIKRYNETQPENIAKEVGVAVEDLPKLNENPNGVNFDKVDSSGLAFEYPSKDGGSSSSTTEEPKPTPVEERTKRRTEWKQAADVQRRAMHMQKEAEEKIKKADEIQSLLERAKTDPTAVARALGLSPEQFLAQYQNHILNIPNEPIKKPEDEIKERLAKYEEERQKEREAFAQFQTSSVKNNYVSNKILPVIVADKDRFEILNGDDAATAASYIYDLMNEHYRQYGEELNPLDVAEEMENALAKELEEKLLNVRKYKKFSKHFTELPAEAQLGETDEPREVRTSSQDNQLGAPKTTTEDNSLTARRSQNLPERKKFETIGGTNNPATANSGWQSKRERKLEIVAKKILGNA